MVIAGQVQMDRGIARFADGVADYRPIWPIIGDEFRAQVKDQFKTEGEEGGARWAALSPEYAGWKAVHYPGMKILHRTGVMEDSLTKEGAPGAVFIGERKRLTMGTSISYAVYHQRGTSRMPARPEIQLTETFKRLAMKNAQAYLVQVASKAGFRPGRGPIDTSRLASYFMMQNTAVHG
jgi:phage gpG-like protein